MMAMSVIITIDNVLSLSHCYHQYHHSHDDHYCYYLPGIIIIIVRMIIIVIISRESSLSRLWRSAGWSWCQCADQPLCHQQHSHQWHQQHRQCHQHNRPSCHQHRKISTINLILNIKIIISIATKCQHHCIGYALVCLDLQVVGWMLPVSRLSE